MTLDFIFIYVLVFKFGLQNSFLCKIEVYAVRHNFSPIGNIDLDLLLDMLQSIPGLQIRAIKSKSFDF